MPDNFQSLALCFGFCDMVRLMGIHAEDNFAAFFCSQSEKFHIGVVSSTADAEQI